MTILRYVEPWDKFKKIDVFVCVTVRSKGIKVHRIDMKFNMQLVGRTLHFTSHKYYKIDR